MKKPESQESIQVSGHFGPIRADKSPIELEISPLTVFIGPQGTGKSLISQFLYFFRDAEYLISNHSKQSPPTISVRKVVEGIRAGNRDERVFSPFVISENVDIQYISNTEDRKTWEISFSKSANRIQPKGEFKQAISTLLSTATADPSTLGNLQARALFVPAARSFFSRLINSDPQALGDSSLPITMREFTSMLFKAGNTHHRWQLKPDEIPLEVSEVDNIMTRELRGHAVFSKTEYTRRWQWIPEGSKSAIEIEMSSSGQMETWPMVSIMQAMFGWEASQRPLYIHIEEPETHLHPSAQVAIAKLLAYLCNKSFRIVITTHSIFILYVLNNLVLANQNLSDKNFEEDVPEVEQRLNPNQLSAYLFADGDIVSIRDSESGELDGKRLSSVLGYLEEEYLRIQSYGTFWS